MATTATDTLHIQLSLLAPAPAADKLALLTPAPATDKLGTALARLSALLASDSVGSSRAAGSNRSGRTTPVPPAPRSAASRSAASRSVATRSVATRSVATRSVATRSVAPQPPPGVRRRHRQGGGLLALRALRPPLELEVLTIGGLDEAIGGSPARPDFLRPAASAAERRPHVQGKVRVASGPWNLEEARWSETPLLRDYWDVELAGGGLYRIFRDRDDGRWYADGIYD